MQAKVLVQLIIMLCLAYAVAADNQLLTQHTTYTSSEELYG